MTAVQRGDPDVWVRQATRADLLAIVRIEQSVFSHPWPYAAFERQLDTAGFLVAAEQSGLDSVAGYVVGDTIPGHGRPLGHIKDIAVRSTRQGDGIGRLLLSRGVAALAGQGAHTVKLEVRESNEVARHLYEEFGFEYIRRLREYYADGEDAGVMAVRLADRDGF
ncbi:ribosomal protein S18-alanine N-acetyltransferase [Halobacterium salinarum]|uniref:ribosomal protein S18-alanine N-acetyltransferase n=1 Tax=Halobacterium salinarum TaxID=2242 RepID=UPI002554BD7C|nr:ribosomal protein S18-alanine N-acetyltransferase [Halobacterium salinarum]MDL0124779.1 ribosomal protein S18-alanine N-acetyltransferase [Halobacterium salinarum]